VRYRPTYCIVTAGDMPTVDKLATVSRMSATCNGSGADAPLYLSISCKFSSCNINVTFNHCLRWRGGATCQSAFQSVGRAVAGTTVRSGRGCIATGPPACFCQQAHHY